MTELSPEAIIAGFRGLSSRRRRQALAIACRDALAIWEGFAARIGKIEYCDGPGPYRAVDLELPARALDEVERRLAGERVDSRETERAYSDPIIALQHDKFELPPEVECAFYAIHYLHRLEHGNYWLAYGRDVPYLPADEVREREVLEQVLNAIDAPLGDWLRDWWIRVWDRWITTEAPRYAASVMTAGAFDALAAGDPARALEQLEAPSLLRAIARSMQGRPGEAVDEALGVLGARGPAVRAWVARNLRRLAPDAIAFAPRGDRYAVIAGDRLAVVDLADRGRRWSVTLRGPARRVLFTDGRETVWAAGERVDAIGVAATFRYTEELPARDPGHPDEIAGVRAIAALGEGGAIVPCHEREVRLLAPPHGDSLRSSHGDSPRSPGDAVLGRARVAGAAFSERGGVVATHDGRAVSIWRRAGGLFAGFAPAAAPVELFVGDRRVLIRCADGVARLYRLDGARVE